MLAMTFDRIICIPPRSPLNVPTLTREREWGDDDDESSDIYYNSRSLP